MSDDRQTEWWRTALIVGGHHDGQFVRVDTNRPQVILRERLPIPLAVPTEAEAAKPVERREHIYQRMELFSGEYRGPEMSTFIYHDANLMPWQVLGKLVSGYRP